MFFNALKNFAKSSFYSRALELFNFMEFNDEQSEKDIM